MNIEQIKEKILTPKKTPVIPDESYLSTGSTLLNLACSGKARGGLVKGKYFFFVGDSASGKTFLALTCFAEAAINKNFDDYRLIYDDVEGGALMDFEKYFGAKTASRIEPPKKGKDGSHVHSSTVEEFYFNVDEALKGKPFIYVLDSMDSLSSESELEKFQTRKSAFGTKKKVAGEMSDGKAKRNSSGLRQLMHPLQASGSILIIISQTRDNIGFGSQFNPKTRSGGHAVTFYACLEMWSSIRERIKARVRGKDRQQGIITRIKVKKNRLTGREVSVDVPILWNTGIDDVGSCVDYLVEEGHWKETKGGIIVPELDLDLDREELIAKIEEDSLELELKSIVSKVWREIQEACSVTRKNRYS